jgi:hypothetical protein
VSIPLEIFSLYEVNSLRISSGLRHKYMNYPKRPKEQGLWLGYRLNDPEIEFWQGLSIVHTDLAALTAYPVHLTRYV